ncbi:hypothetical protein QBC47DRAFT_393863 [Echria macrotheca]|uniref:DNA replication factor Cdt1 C-terminal domain-containing protein n=1 Tax=Echria macrotheca TaxID=438768 RepID=A0AAJ0B766_9PEZI|nr:hypothetical protein QBC47DRAFT_393863 [Echria macrotheca]
MPGAISRAPRATRGRPAAAPKSTSSLDKFARVSKLPSIGKDIGDKAAALKSGRYSTIEVVLTRKRSATDDIENVPPQANGGHKKVRLEAETKPKPIIAPVSRKKKTVTFAEPEPVKSSPSRKRRFEPESETTPEPEALLERLNLSSPIRKRTKTVRTQPDNDFDLPRELLDLLDLQIAFLKTLSMSIAHNGSSSPIDLRTIYSSISQSWGKRQVTVDDIRLCLGVLNWAPVKADKSETPFFIADYGRGRICIERGTDSSYGPLREQKLNMDFESNLRTLWLSRRDQNAHVFLATLPRAAIKKCAEPHPITVKGQRTLMELKNGVVRKQQTETPKPTLLNPDGSQMTLLERIRHKDQLRKEQAAHEPTPAELARKAALQRAEDIAAVIGMLCMATSSGQARVSFTMAALMTKIKDSLRNPISSEDGVCCVKILASEIAPQWLRIVTVGGRENIVLQTAMQPTKVFIQEKVKALLG